MKKNNNNYSNIIKALAAIAAIIVLISLTARFIGRSETLTDYAAKHPEQQVKAQITPIPEKESETDSSDTAVSATNDADTEAMNEAADPTVKQEESVTEDVAGEKENAANTAGPTEFDDEYAGTDSRVIVAEGFYYEPVPQAIRGKMQGVSYPDDIDESKVNYDVLRYLRLKYIDFDGNEAEGEMVCNVGIVDDVAQIFNELYLHGYQIQSIRLIDEYDADDTASMIDNNTSCFCYRVVDGSTHLSNHAYGRAIDLNPFYNPYIVYGKGENGGDYISPEGSEVYTDRSADFPHKIDENDLAYKLFKQHGFKWGGDWNTMKDYQHFEKKG